MGVRSAGDRLAGSATSASSSSSSGSTSPNHTRLFLNAPANYLTYLPSHRLPLSSGRGSGLPTGLPAPVGGSAQHLRTSALGGAGKHYGGTGRRSHGTGTGNHRLSWFARCNMRRCPNHGAPSGRFRGSPDPSGGRSPNRAVPTRTRVAPSSTATSKSAVIPIDSSGRPTPAASSAVRRKAARVASGSSPGAGIAIS